jgi:uncharacterized phage-associated protein
MDIKKIVSILNFLARNVNYPSKMKICKLLYYADKEHFIQYGRFITEDTYMKIKYGPIPSWILDLINEPEKMLNREDLHYLKKYITFSNTNNRIIISLKPPDLDELSISETKIFNSVIRKYKFWTAIELKTESHKETFWNGLKLNDKIEPKHFASDLPEIHSNELLNYYNQNQKEKKVFNKLLNS